MVCLLLRASIFARFPLESFIEHGGFSERGVFLLNLVLPARACAILEAGANHPAGVPVIGKLCVLQFRGLLSGVESCRERAHLDLELTSLRIAQSLAAALSGAFAFCLFWLSYLLSGGGPRSTRNMKKSALTARVVRIWHAAASSVLMPSFIALMSYYQSDGYLSWLSACCYVGPSFLGLYFCNLSSEPFPPITAHKMEKEAVWRFHCVAVFTLLWRLVTLVFLYQDPSLVTQILALLLARAGSEIPEAALLFFLIDLVGLTLCLIYFVFFEDGIKVALCTLVGALSVLGPAPTFAIYCVYRSDRLRIRWRVKSRNERQRTVLERRNPARSRRAATLAPKLTKILPANNDNGLRGLSSHLVSEIWGAVEGGVNHPVGYIVLGELCFLVPIYVLLGMTECLRVRTPCKRMTGFLSWAALVAVPLLQLLPASLSASASFALGWLPFYLRARAPDRSSSGTLLGRYRWGFSTLFSFYVLHFNLMALSFAHRAAWVMRGFQKFFDWSNGPLITLFWIFGVARNSGPTLAILTRKNYLVAAAFSALWRALTLVLLYKDPTLPSQAWSQALRLLTSEGFADTSEAAVWFSMLDLISFTLLFVYFALLEDGPRVALRTLAGALLLGPAPAFALYCAYRENEIAKAVRASVRKDDQIAKAA
ncbi:hypothetical protein KFL_000250550 [Klebsormidium nitens]|uniref:Uncharacterized protein n=1 Tax=Klebsormidium nitens TaxID=105231 RepID=A0A1Y1HPP3_KLENI|nr:hypothetical protein KFL_000250550 [Klebsormidium nitens]|eukprot:GAQ79179.1 hypothetical protein KFL_000250550 [Klebsormidium nitens]